MSRLLLLGLVAGGVLRAAVLANPGTPDVPTWKTWSYEAAQDPLGLYGVGGHPPERRVLRWQNIDGTTEYPPLGLVELGAVGRVYRAVDPGYRDSPWLTRLIKLPGLLAEVVLVVVLLTIGRRVLGTAATRWMAMAFWLNPAVVINGAALGYLDAQMAVPAVLSLIAVMAGRPGLAGVLATAAVLTKVQALFLAPALLLALARQPHLPVGRSLVRFLMGALATATCIVLPVLWHGAGPNMVQAVGRAATHDMLSGLAANTWWLVTWMVRAAYAAPVVGWLDALTSPVRILAISRFVEVGFFDPKPLAVVLVLTLTAWFFWRCRDTRSPAVWAFAGGWTMLTYFVWNVPVHENHLYLAVPLFALAAALDARYRAAFWIVSVITAANMFLFYGIGRGELPVEQRTWIGMDLTVILALLTCGTWVWLTWRVSHHRLDQAAVDLQ